MGRPSSFSAKLADEICQELIDGKSLREICQSDEMPNASTVCRWLGDDRHAEFCKQYARAREIQADTLFDEVLDIADDARNDWMKRNGGDDDPGWVANSEHIQRSRLRIDARKWMAGKLRPKKYGEKLDIDQKTTHEAGDSIKSLMDQVNGRTRSK